MGSMLKSILIPIVLATFSIFETAVSTVHIVDVSGATISLGSGIPEP